MYQKLRSIHLSTALFSMAFLLAYAISAVEFAHRKWVSHPEHSTNESRKLAAGITDARVLARQWRGELTSIENSPGFLKFQVMTALGTSYNVTYSIATGVATVKTTSKNFLTTLAFVHASHGVWAVVAAGVSLALLTLGITGLYLWFQNHSSRRMGSVLLLIGVMTAAGLIISMRGG